MFRFLSAAAVAAVAIIAFAAPAGAEPATTVVYPLGTSATWFHGQAFDTCTAPAYSSIKAWNGTSPFHAVGVYIAGANRTCAQPQLTASWVRDVSALRWRLIPIYKGLQPPCGGKPTDRKISRTPSVATSQGDAAAEEAVHSATALGMLAGSAIYNDIENYATTDATCRTAVLRFASAWTKGLHRHGYLSGIYVNLSSGARDLAAQYGSTLYARPDAVWIARFDGNPALSGWSGVADAQWASHQRAKQYLGDRSRTYGGVRMNIDLDNVDAPAATVRYSYRVTSSDPLNGRTGPTVSSPVGATYPAGSTVQVVCQTAGSLVGSTRIWDRLSDGRYVTDYYVSTPSNTGYSAPIPFCRYPYQVTGNDGLNERSGPGVSHSVVGRLSSGALAWVVCQASGSKVGTSPVWDQLSNGYWVTDFYLATPSNTTFSGPAKRC